MLPCSSSNRSVLRHRLGATRPVLSCSASHPFTVASPAIVSSSRNEVPTPSVVTLLSLTNPSASRVRGPASFRVLHRGITGDDPGTGSRVVNLSSRRWKNIRRLRGSECRR
jgi:hypothetical protein